MKKKNEYLVFIKEVNTQSAFRNFLSHPFFLFAIGYNLSDDITKQENDMKLIVFLLNKCC
jgi:hypothetical protein